MSACIYVDVTETLIGNAALSSEECAGALAVIERCVGHEAVQLVSSDANGPVLELQVHNKAEALKSARAGSVWIDDDDAVLRAAMRSGLSPIRASALSIFAAMLDLAFEHGRAFGIGQAIKLAEGGGR